MENKLKIKDYADLKDISIPTVYKRINKGLIKVYKEGRNVFIITDEPVYKDFEEKEHPTDLLKEIELLKNQNEELRKDKEELRKDKEILNKRLEESNILQLKTIEAFKQIDYKLDAEKKKTWLYKLFKK